jgi:trans-aconitate methyltransferase
MKDSDAIELIRAGVPKNSKAHWADLGSGSGTFTKALAHLLKPGSTIIAVDKENHRIISPNDPVTITSQQADFTTATLPHSLDGILMANSLHYVKDQHSFIQHVSRHLNSQGRLLLIEYDTDRANAWIPYPITFEKLKELFFQAGYTSISKIGALNSAYNQNKIYACVASGLS